MDWSVFWGISSSIALGALAFFIVGIFNDFSTRKYLIFGLKNEIKNNLTKINSNKIIFGKINFVLKIMQDYHLRPEFIFEISRQVYDRYFYDLKLLNNEELVQKIYNVYGIDLVLKTYKEMFTTFLLSMKLMEHELEKDLEISREEMKDINEKIKSIDESLISVKKQNLKNEKMQNLEKIVEKKLGNIEKLEENLLKIFDDIKNKTQAEIINTEKIFLPDLSNEIKETIDIWENNANELINSLDIAKNISFGKFFIFSFTRYIRKNKA